MNNLEKEFVFDLLLRELQAELELESKSEETKTVLEATKDFTHSYFKGIERLTNFMMIQDTVDEVIKQEK